MLTPTQPYPEKVPGRIAELVSFPLQRIHIELTNVCNFDCTFCPKQEMTRKYEYMSFDRACSLIDQVARYRLAEKITFHVMGEPFMHPRFFDILDYAALKGVKTGITTNGTYLDEEIAAKLEKVTVGQINVSLQTPDEASFQTRKARRMDFEGYRQRILRFIGACLRHKTPPKIKVHFLNTKFKSEVPGEDWTLGTMSVLNNTEELRRTFSYWARSIHEVCTDMPDTEKQAVEEKIRKLSIFKWNVVPVAPHVYFETYVLNTWGNAFVDEHVVPSKVGYCSALTDHFAVLVNGDLTYCCKDYDGQTRAGNVFEQPIVDILNSRPVLEAIEGFRNLRVVHPHCQKCLGGSTRLKSLGNSLGSIIIWKYLKNFFYKKA
ncbi:MAG: radical SAM protein [Nitrospinaceae bacterium]|nr:radical SAM protein [Nitrospinaceae bacterium]NIR54054.1 radical SAM protein [Nitrospinaceae bacterium]NIS84471.1 radical SAM protein [Nitrospinaceae bacterium]NIT81267.1 radical SAM protein [Nitrospinaceae bacterium]NIU43554.1 radical SAM protein [Nitrospinaceae bacterium]